MTTRDLANDTIRIAVAAQQELVRVGLTTMLAEADSMEVVGIADHAGDITRTVLAHRPDVMIVDADLVDTAASSTIRQSVAQSPGTRFLLVTSPGSPPTTIRRLFDIGATGVISRDAPHEELFEAITCLLRGTRYLHPSLGARLAQRRADLTPLTERERHIVELVALGHTNVEIGRMLYVSTRTVETHRAQVMAKLGLHSRAEFVRWALDNRVIGPTPDDAGSSSYFGNTAPVHS
jgi:two-component system response regulator NreC